MQAHLHGRHPEVLPALADATPRVKVITIGRDTGNRCYRWRNHGAFGLLLNAILHWNDRPADSVPASAPSAAR